jgi:hypothetical protein
MIHLRTRRLGRISLRRLNPTDLHLQKELRNFNRQTAARAPNARFRRQINVEAVLEFREIGIRERGRGREFLQSEPEGCVGGFGEVDGGESGFAGCYVGDVGEGFCGRGAGDGGGEGGGYVGDFGGEGGGADEEAGFGLAGCEEGGGGAEGEQGEEGVGCGVHLGCCSCCCLDGDIW